MRFKRPQLLILLPLIPICLLVGGRVPYFILYVILGTLLIPLIHGGIGLYSLKLRVDVPGGKLVAGEVIRINYGVENPLGISFPSVEIHYDLAGQRSSSMEEGLGAFSLEPKDYYHGERVLTLNRRGVYQMGKVILEIHDPFGFYSLRKSLPVPLQLTVYPRVRGLHHLQVEASQFQGELLVQNPLFQDQVTLIGLKPYQLGDSMKKIHWKASARGPDLMVKSFEERGDTEVYVFLNSTARCYAQDQAFLAEDQLVEISLSLIHHCLRGGLGVTLTYCQGDSLEEISGSQGGDYQRFLDALVSFSPQGASPFEIMIERRSATIPQGSTLLMLTPELNKALAIQGIQMKMKNLQPIYFLMEKPEGNGPLNQGQEELKRALQGEGIRLYSIGLNQEIRKVLEGFYAMGG